MTLGPGKHVWLAKMRAGEPFDTPDLDFIDAILAAQATVHTFNAYIGSDFEAMVGMLRGVFGKLGANSFVMPRVAVDVGFNVEIGDNTFINQNATLLDSYPIRIGNDVQIGPNCAFYPVGHPLRVAERRIVNPETGEHSHKTTGAPIVIEDSVWLGGNVVVLPGVTIGARSVIGAGSVVTKSIPPDVFAAGNPCRVIKPIIQD
jgi:maltose O-acetyltransferase